MNFIEKLDTKLKGAPDGTLTLILLGVAAFAIFVAFKGSPTLKAAVTLWLLMP
jgi:hypothetical protein